MAHKQDSTDNDVPRLPREADQVTKEFLEETLRCVGKRDDVLVKDFSVTSATSKGENYASIVLRVTVICQEGNKERMHHLIIKLLPDNEYLKKLIRSMKYVDKEIMAYKDLFPAFIQYQIGKGLEPIRPSVPSFYHGVLNDEQAIIALQDISREGYKMADRQKGFDYEHCKLVMKELANFHALSYAMKNGNVANLKEKFDLACMNVIYSDGSRHVLEPVLQNGIKTAADMINAVGADEKATEHLNKLLKLDIFSTVQDVLTPEEPYSVICHGDAWCNNMMFKYGNGDDSAPTDMKLLDFQVVRYSLPTTDLAFFFFTSTTRSLRKTHLNNLLHLYHKSFIDALHHVNVKIPDFSFEMLTSMFKKTMLFGVICGCCLLPAILGKPADIPDASDHQTKEDFHNMMKDISQNVLTGSSKMLVHERLVGAIQDAGDAGML